ncbi:DUF2007 domain-containing protein [Flavobacterium sp.]|uniref:DUF2007 domain-containing protein n=1 Tax=Flavobacterium sp. TaxID=239 RepID=UPI002B4B0304|nr:DUF2007 domain-containing protein [Flavobacterium sp.]HLF50988.1 hypothetical protein [Flavobacterium sp.]
MEEFVTVAIFYYPHEIVILKHLLDDAQLHYYFENEMMTTIAPMYTQALGGIKLKVHPNDIETVKEILDQLNDETNLKIV